MVADKWHLATTQNNQENATCIMGTLEMIYKAKRETVVVNTNGPLNCCQWLIEL